MSATIIPLRQSSGRTTKGTHLGDLDAVLCTAERIGPAGSAEVQATLAELRRRHDELLTMLEDFRRQDRHAHPGLMPIVAELETAAALTLTEIALLSRRAQSLLERLGAGVAPGIPRR